jgi:Interferon-induced transmembrane protein
MSYPPAPPGGSSDQPDWQGQQPDQPGWSGQQPGWQGQQPGWPAQQPGWQGQQPGWPGQQPGWGGQPPPENYLVWAILTTLFCCLPTGIVSIVYSTRVSGLWGQGLYAEAQTAANNAKKWAIISAIAWVVLIVGYFLFVVVLGIFSLGVIGSNLPSTPTTHYHRY